MVLRLINLVFNSLRASLKEAFFHLHPLHGGFGLGRKGHLEGHGGGDGATEPLRDGSEANR